MRIGIISGALVLSLQLTAFASETQVLKFSGDPGFEAPLGELWTPNGKASSRLCSIVPDGKTGKALLMDAKDSFAEVFSRSPILIEPETDRIKLSIYIKGTGKYEVMLFCYDQEYLQGITLLRGNVNDADGWKQFQTEYVFDLKKYPELKKMKYVQIAIRTEKGGKIMFDDLNCERISKE